MNIKPIRSKKQLKTALARVDEIIDAQPGSCEYDELEVLSTLIEAFENKHYPIDPPHPIEAIKFRMEQMQLKNSDISHLMGGKNRVSEVLSGKRGLSLNMIRNLHYKLGIPAESLLAAVK